MNFKNLASELLARSESICNEWFPAGKKRGHEYVIGDLHGNPGESLSINLNTGVWKDFASGDGGGDLIALYAAIHNIEQGEALKRLSNGHAPVCMSKPIEKKPTKQSAALNIVLPVPAGASAPSMRHYEYGVPSATWCYQNQRGEALGYVARYDIPNSRKQFAPYVWADGKGWVSKQFPEPRPLYGLQRLTLGARVLVVEGEKAADAAQRIVGDRYAVVTWPGGARALGKADFSPLEGRKVLLWPDSDKDGIDAMHNLAERLRPVCPEVKVLNVSGQPDGWDAADSGFDWPAFLAWARPRAEEFQPPAPVTLPPAPITAPPPSTVQAPSVGLWGQLGLALTDKGHPIQNLDNVVRAIEADPDLRGRIWYDEFLDAIITTWQGPQRQWKDADDVLLQLYMQRHIGLNKIGVQTCHDAALVAAFHDTRNECREWLSGLSWDGVPRLAYLMSEGFGAEENTYTEAVGRCWVISMVARVMKPGCKVDTVPVLEGVQGAGKSTALRILGGKWFTECHESVLTKDFYGVLQGHMLVEISEMHSFTRAEVERVKGIISCQVDRFRRAYGRNTEDHPRQTVLVCTTNRDDWQRDDTGARRFWPVRCNKVDQEWLRHNRDQVFAEAVKMYRDGVSWWDVPVEMQQQETHIRREVDSWERLIERWLIGRSRVFVDQILSECLQIEVGHHDQLVQKRVGRIMRALGWDNRPLRDVDGRIRKTWTANT